MYEKRWEKRRVPLPSIRDPVYEANSRYSNDDSLPVSSSMCKILTSAYNREREREFISLRNIICELDHFKLKFFSCDFAQHNRVKNPDIWWFVGHATFSDYYVTTATFKVYGERDDAPLRDDCAPWQTTLNDDATINRNVLRHTFPCQGIRVFPRIRFV